jgi:hypothetical protein
MSDDGWGEDAGDDNGGWGDDPVQEEGNELENTYYQAEATINEPIDAIEKFETAITFAEGQDEYDYRFKSMMWITYLSSKCGDYEKMEVYCNKLLAISHKVSPNDVEMAIEKVINALDSFLNELPDLQGKMYKKILD